MAIRINAHELHDLLKTTPSQQNIMLIGKHGIGKSEIIMSFYRKLGMPIVAFFLGQMSDPGDLLGLPHKDEQTGKTVFLPPFWWPFDDKPVVLFLDELNRGRPEILQTVFDLVLNKKLAGRQLPEGTVVIAAVNEGEEYQLTDLDPALVSRFNLYEFAPTVEDWLVWANTVNVDQRVIDFIQKNPHQLDGETASAGDVLLAAGLVKTADRRAWVRLSDFIKPLAVLEDAHVKMIAGIVGTGTAVSFKQSLGKAIRVTVEQILRKFDHHKNKLRDMPLQEIILLNEQIILWINGQKYKPSDGLLIRSNLLAYLLFLQKLKHTEAVAHVASTFENPNFEAATEFMSESMELLTFLMDYIQGIKAE